MTSLFSRISNLPLLRDAGLYVLVNGIASLFPLLALPVITRVVSPTDYGIYAVFLVGVNLLMPLVGLGMETAAGRKYVDKDSFDYPGYIATSLGLTVALALLAYGLLITLAPTLTKVVPIPTSWFWAWISVAWSQTIFGLILVLHQMANRPAGFGTWRIGRAFVLNGLLLTFVLLGLSGWTDLITVLILAHGGGAVAGLIWLWRRQLIGRDARTLHLQHIVKYGAPLVPHMIGAALVTATDRILLVNLLDEAAAGIYTVGYQVGQVMFLFAQSITRAWTPWFYEKLKDGSAVALRTSITTGYMVALLFIIAGVGFAGVGWFALPLIFGDVYSASSQVFVWIVAAFVVQGLWSLTASYLYYSEDTAWISASSVGAALLNVGFTYLLIQSNGIVGAAQGTFSAYAIGMLVVIVVTVRRAPLPWTLKSQH